MRSLFTWIISLVDIAVTAYVGEVARLAQIRPGGRSLGEVYRESVIRLTMFFGIASVVSPILITVFGSFQWFNVAALIILFFWIAVTAMLWFALLPIGIALQLLFNLTGDKSTRYTRLAAGIAFAEAAFTLFAMLFPLGRDLAIIPVLIAAVIVYAIGTKARFGGFFSFLARGLAFIVIVVYIIGLMFPKTGEAMKTVPDRIDRFWAPMFQEGQSISLSTGGTQETYSFEINKGEEKVTVMADNTTLIYSTSNYPLNVVFDKADGTRGVWPVRPGASVPIDYTCWTGTSWSWEVVVKGLHDGTKVTFKVLRGVKCRMS